MAFPGRQSLPRLTSRTFGSDLSPRTPDAGGDGALIEAAKLVASGTGLGLHLSAQGGDIEVASRPGRGRTGTLRRA
jgi:hypothetical protein